MSLLSPTAGEVMDRLSIVALKLDAYAKAGKDTARLENEAFELRAYLNRFRSSRKLKLLQERISDINLTIWKAEDEVRAWRTHHQQSKLCEFALRIARYNDYRSKVIREIDAACGVESVEEKIYA